MEFEPIHRQECILQSSLSWDFNLDGQLDLLAVLSATYNQTSEQK